MQRHGKSVPPEFYTRFTRDAVQLAESHCQGKCVSVLEGGYSDRALTSGVIAHLVGLAGMTDESAEELCQVATLAQLDRLAKMASSSMKPSANSVPVASANRRRQDYSARDPAWLKYTLEAFKRLQESCGKVRQCEQRGSATAPSTPMAGVTADWRSPRETRSSKPLASAKASPVK